MGKRPDWTRLSSTSRRASGHAHCCACSHAHSCHCTQLAAVLAIVMALVMVALALVVMVQELVMVVVLVLVAIAVLATVAGLCLPYLGPLHACPQVLVPAGMLVSAVLTMGDGE
jgi:hypothetical protein